MRILWSVNTISPEIAEKFNISSSHSISWVDAMSKELSKCNDISLAIVSPCGDSEFVQREECNGITYYFINKRNKGSDVWKRIIDEFNPDVIHAYGTEGKHNIGLINEAKNKVPIVISLQGLVGEYSKYYYAGIPLLDIVFNYTIGDLLLHRGIIEKKKSFKKQSKLEVQMLKSVQYVEGRSDWDRVYSKKINRDLKYYYCPRMLREPFYKYSWNCKDFQKHSILVHQATYPIKGLHMVLDALSIVKKNYPNVKMYIAGKTNFSPTGIKERLLYTGYTKYIKKKITNLNLEENIEFTGYLSAEEMAEKLSEVNVCIIPSSIENAPNALAEAMVVGTPIISSFAGGSPDMLNEGQCGLLYRFEEPEMMADRIESYFVDNELAKTKANNARIVARNRHDPNKLINIIKEIYEKVIIDYKRNSR